MVSPSAAVRTACQARLGEGWEDSYEAIHQAFDVLTLAAIVDDNVLVIVRPAPAFPSPVTLRHSAHRPSSPASVGMSPLRGTFFAATHAATLIRTSLTAARRLRRRLVDPSGSREAAAAAARHLHRRLAPHFPRSLVRPERFGLGHAAGRPPLRARWGGARVWAGRDRRLLPPQSGCASPNRPPDGRIGRGCQ